MTPTHGDFVVRRHYRADGSDWLEVLQADDRIAISRELLTEAASAPDLRLIQDGPFVGLLGEYGYRATGEVTDQGDPIYQCVCRP